MPTVAVFVSLIVAEDVSVRRRYGSAVFVAGPETKAAVTEAESPVAPRNDNVATAEVAVYVSAVVCAAVAAESVSVSELIAAFEGATETRLRPKAATAISATRLIVVDICFLSIVDPRTIRGSA